MSINYLASLQSYPCISANVLEMDGIFIRQISQS